MRFFLFASCTLLLLSCSPYPILQKATIAYPTQLEEIQPTIERTLYRAQVSGKVLLKKFNLSGLLLFKRTEDQVTHVVFQNEMGLNYFHFTWDYHHHFKVLSIIPQMNRKALIKTLKKDFEILLMISKTGGGITHYNAADSTQVLRVPLEQGFVDYRYHKSNRHCLGATLVDKRKVITTFEFSQPVIWKDLPNHMLIRHRTAGFNIELTKLERTHDTQ